MTVPSRAPRYGTPDFEYLGRMAATVPEADGPVYMVNLMKYRDVADYGDGKPSGRSGREADNLYAPLEILRDLGAELVFVAEVEEQILGESPKWDRIGIVKYPTRRAFLEMQQLPDFHAKHVHKEAGMEQTIVMSCLPLPVPELPAVPKAELEPGDQPFVMMHILKFADGGQDAMAQYGATAGAQGLALGVRPEAMFSVEGTVLGDGRQWDQVRLNRFPGHAIYRQLRANATHQAGQPTRRSALSDTYTMMLLPTIDRFAESLPQ
ncbi:MAG: hypothetical protein AB7J35_15255 [Dehalococcoidia bacterium]